MRKRIVSSLRWMANKLDPMIEVPPKPKDPGPDEPVQRPSEIPMKDKQTPKRYLIAAALFWLAMVGCTLLIPGTFGIALASLDILFTLSFVGWLYCLYNWAVLRDLVPTKDDIKSARDKVVGWVNPPDGFFSMRSHEA
jgi:hypothetical protein